MQSTRFSQMAKVRSLRSSWEIKMQERQEKKMVKDFAKQLKEEKQQKVEEKKRRREENLKRRLENERKAEVVQVIRNPAKLKRTQKKRLRGIEKRDTLMLSKPGERKTHTENAVSNKRLRKKKIPTST